jgi:multiple sugar transport system permease protein
MAADGSTPTASTLTLGAAGQSGRSGALMRERRQRRAAYLRLAPFLFLFVVILAYPLLYSLYLSFFDATLNQTPVFVGLGNFVRLATDAEFHTSVRNTAYFAVFVVIGETILPLFMAIAMNERLPGRTVLRTAYFLPVVTSWTVVSLIWSMLFAQQGLANSVVQLLGFPAQPFFSDPTQAMWIIIAVSIWRNLGYFMVIYLAALQGVPQELYEAASMDGATRLRQIWHVAIPAVRPVIYFVITITIIRSMQLFEQPFIMTNGGPLNATLSIVQLLYRHAFVNLEFGYGSAIATFLLVLLVALALVNKRIHDLVVQ